MPRLISAVVVNFNSAGHLQSCLTALATSLAGQAWDGVVVDNASTDGSETAAEAWRPNVSLCRQPVNAGFSAAVNLGLALTGGDYVLILNPDAVLAPDSVGLLAAELDAHPECALVGPCLFEADGTVQGSARGDPDMWTGLFGRATLLTRLFPWFPVARRNVRVGGDAPRASVEVDWVSGACMLARRSALAAVGGFDHRYFLYWEDADLCRRLRNRGFTVRYVLAARATHATGGSSRTVRPLAIRAFHRSAYTYYTTHVAPGRINPAAWIAWLLLRVRCAWKLAAERVYRFRMITRS
jgi:GT2 family glycosyltransferase